MHRYRRRSIEDRFWAKVQRSESCWLWAGAATPYGHLSINRRMVRAHRVSWALHYGAIPIGLDVLHHCDTPACVRPDHLFAGTHGDNMRDMWAKGRGKAPTSGGGKRLTLREANDRVRASLKGLRVAWL